MIVVFGATGTVGRLLVSSILDRGEKVRAVSRHPDTADLPASAEIVGADLDDPASLPSVLDGAAAVFVATSGDIAAHDTAAAGAAAAAGVGRLVKLSVVSAEDPDASKRTPARGHLAGEQAIAQSGVPWNFLRPGEFMTNALRWSAQLGEGDVVTVPFAHVSAAPVDPREVAEIGVRALRGDLPAGVAYPLSGPQQLSPADQVVELGKALGRHLRCEPIPDEKVRQGMLANGMPADLVTGLFDHLREPRVEDTVYDTYRQITGRAPRSFEHWVADHLGAFRHAP